MELCLIPIIENSSFMILNLWCLVLTQNQQKLNNNKIKIETPWEPIAALVCGGAGLKHHKTTTSCD